MSRVLSDQRGWRRGFFPRTCLATVLLAAPLFGAQLSSASGGASYVLQSKPARLEPFAESRLQLNPPTFRWPVGKETAGAYRLELARDPSFANPRVENVGDLWFRPLEPLAVGKWHWRVRAANSPSGAWLGTESFEIGADLPKWALPEWREMVARLPSVHPRIYVSGAELPALAANATRLGERLKSRRAEIDRALAESFSLEPYVARAARPVENANGRGPAPRLRIIESKAASLAACTPATEGAWLWAATREPALLAAVKRRAMLIAGFAPDGFISERADAADAANVDFGNSYAVHALGVLYDLLYSEFSPEERSQIRAAILARARPVFAKLAHCSQELMRAHGWQHGYLDVMVGAIAVADEEPEVRPWIETGLKAFVAFYPWFGGNDGGSQEGTRYFHGQESIASLETVEVLRHAFGLKLDEGNPWFRASPYFLIYSFPPGGAMARLGDSNGTQIRDHDDLQAPDGKSRMVALGMAALYGNRHAAAYAALAPEEGYGFGVAEMLRWSGGTAVEPLSLATLPAARLFRDIGAVYTHSALTQPEENVRLVFHSSPYGGHGHSHADQNSFHIIAYGEDLLIDSGYYPAFNNADPHRLQWSVQTKAHNAILVDGAGQSWGDTRGHGRISHFEQNADWVYMVGSAEHAYPAPALARVDRHIVWLRGSAVQTYVIVDELAGADDTRHRFDWLLHAAHRMNVDASQRKVRVHGQSSEAEVTFLEPAVLEFAQGDQFDAPAVGWRDGVISPLPDQWHLKATPPAAAHERFVVAVQVSKPGVAKPAPRVSAEAVEVAGWRVKFQPAEHRLRIERLP